MGKNLGTHHHHMLKALMDKSTFWKTTDTDLSSFAKLIGATFTGPITGNGSTPLYSLPSAVAMLAGATCTGVVTTAGLSLGDNNLNFKIGTISYSRMCTTTMLKARMDNSLYA